MTIDVMALQAVPADQDAPKAPEGNCCSFTCGGNSCGKTCQTN
ncbi:ALQxL family class IV lanthipeptide [Dactylosporangium sp. NPDC006015]